jgi:transposase
VSNQSPSEEVDVSSFAEAVPAVVGGVDTHRDSHVVVVVDSVGRVLGTETFPATAAGYRRVLTWMRSFGSVTRVGIEGTGAYGAGLARYLAEEEVTVVEVDRPNRRVRRRRGKSDPVDAESAARAALSGEATGVPKTSNGPVEAIRALRVARRGAVKASTQASNGLRDLVVAAPEELRSRMVRMSAVERVELAARFRPGDLSDPLEATKTAMRSLARRHQQLRSEIDELDSQLALLVEIAAPEGLTEAMGVGLQVAVALLATAGDNPDRLHSEASFVALCGASPVDASSGRQVRHRLNRGGDREANSALWRIAFTRMQHDPRTRVYVGRRRAEGKTNKEILRCLKRYIAREIYKQIAAQRPSEMAPKSIPSAA